MALFLAYGLGMGRARGLSRALAASARRHDVGGDSVPAAFESVVLDGCKNQEYPVTPGVLDDRAVRAFCEGQCHAFALALHERTGWPLYWVQDGAGEVHHCFVLDPDGLGVDITGVHVRDEVVRAWGGVQDKQVIAENILQLPYRSNGWRVPRVDVARSFVAPVLALHACGEELYAPGGTDVLLP